MRGAPDGQQSPRPWTIPIQASCSVLRLADAERLQFPVQRRAFHADEFGRARDVAGEARDLRDQVLALENLARIAQRQAHQALATRAGRRRRHHRADLGRQHLDRHLCCRITLGQDHQAFDVVAQLPDPFAKYHQSALSQLLNLLHNGPCEIMG